MGNGTENDTPSGHRTFLSFAAISDSGVETYSSDQYSREANAPTAQPSEPIDGDTGVDGASNSETTMTYLLYGLIAMWLCGLFFLASLNAKDADATISYVAADEQIRRVQPSEPLALRAGAFWFLDALFFGPGIAVAVRVFERIFNLDGSGDTRATRIGSIQHV